MSNEIHEVDVGGLLDTEVAEQRTELTRHTRGRKCI